MDNILINTVLFVTVRVGTAYRHIFQVMKNKNILLLGVLMYIDIIYLVI